MPKYLLPVLLAAGLGLTSYAEAAPDWNAVGQALGKPGMVQPGGVYRVGMPRSDLKVRLDGVDIKPALALGSWLAFRDMGGKTMVMGDLVLTQDELNPVMKKLTEDGIEITAVHNHLLRSEPFTLYMHVFGEGDPIAIATALHDALALSGTPMGTATAATGESTVLDAATIEKALGYKGKASGGVLQFSISRAEPVVQAGMDVPASMGSAIGINFQPTGNGKAATTGDFVLAADEVNPVIRTLRENGIEVTAVHNHMLDEQPRLFFMHFWANADAAKLARGLRAALDHVKVASGEPKAEIMPGCKDVLANQSAHGRDEIAKCGAQQE